MMEQENKLTGITAEELPKKRGKPFQTGYDERRNLEGRTQGSKNFETLLDEAIKKIVKEKKIPNLTDPEVEMVIRAIIEAMKGNFKYFEYLMNKKYGKPTEPIDITTRGESINPLLAGDEVPEEDRQAIEEFHGKLKANIVERLLKKKQDEDTKGKSSKL